MNNIELDRASRKFTQILRHQIVEYNLPVTTGGYVKLNDILKLNLKVFTNITMNDINKIVETNEKKRLELTNINNEVYIRATQGHNKIVGKLINNADALEEITQDYPVQYIFHGTQKKYLKSILANGLNRMERKHIHFVENIESEKQISGFKSISNYIICVDMKKCMGDGIKFYKSSNNVILTEGINGIMPSSYFTKL